LRREAPRDVAIELDEAADVGNQHQTRKRTAVGRPREIAADRVAVALELELAVGHDAVALASRRSTAPAKSARRFV
jgi:hypothetical protein